jgi:hypothetical protein
MMRSGSRFRSVSRSAAQPLVGLVLCALTLFSSVATPLLELEAFSGGPTVESGHDPKACTPKHDHRVCTQVGANLALVSSAHGHHVAHVLVDVAPPNGPRYSTAKPLLEGPPSRAPPLA